MKVGELVGGVRLRALRLLLRESSFAKEHQVVVQVEAYLGFVRLHLGSSDQEGDRLQVAEEELRMCEEERRYSGAP